jgi:hypothetical protein
LPPTISCSSSSLSTYLSVIFLERSAALPISFSFLSSTRPILRLVCVKLARQERSYDDVYRVLLLDSDELSATHGWFDSHTELGGVRGLIWLWLGVGAESTIAKDVFWWFFFFFFSSSCWENDFYCCPFYRRPSKLQNPFFLFFFLLFVVIVLCVCLCVGFLGRKSM